MLIDLPECLFLLSKLQLECCRRRQLFHISVPLSRLTSTLILLVSKSTSSLGVKSKLCWVFGSGQFKISWKYSFHRSPCCSCDFSIFPSAFLMGIDCICLVPPV